MQSKDIPTYPSIVSVLGISSPLSRLAAVLYLRASERQNLASRLYSEAKISMSLVP